jgi:kynurenine formamidase
MSFPYKIIDLTHTLSSHASSWNGGCGFEQELKLDYNDCTTDVKFRVQQIKMHAGIGTHIDAPSHCIPNGKSIHELNLQELVTPCVKIDVSPKVHERYSVLAEDIENFEKRHGNINPSTFVIIHTGWGKFWNDPKKYRNNLVFPSVSKEAALLLLQRDIAGIGIDTLSPDRPDEGYSTHKIILGAGKYIVENVANGESLPATGCYSLALPIKTLNGTEAPARLIALMG